MPEYSMIKKILSNIIKTLKGEYAYNQDGLTTIHNADFIQDIKFSKAYDMGKRTGSWGNRDIQWRAYVACWAADKARSLEGDFVECGVDKGGLAMTVMSYVRFRELPKEFYLLDTYCGLSDKYINEEEKSSGLKPGGYEECYEHVKNVFKDFNNVKIIKGTVPDTLNEVKAEKVAYLSIDMNCMEPEITAAEYFWPKLVSGGVIVLDDYGWPGHIVQKRAFDKFTAERSTLVLPLPTGQGLIIKP